MVEGEYIWDVLNISDVVIQRCSTVAIEAWLMDKHTIELELMPSIGHFLQPRYKNGSIIVKNDQTLVSIVSNLVKKDQNINDEIMKQRRLLLSGIISNRDGSSTEKIALHISSLLTEIEPLGTIEYNSLKSRFKYFIRIVFGMKGYTIIANLWKKKFGDYLGRYDKSFTNKDRLVWERKLQVFMNNLSKSGK
jgi:hypothetical protein